MIRRGRVQAAAAVGAGILLGSTLLAGCRSPTDRFNAYDILLVPPFEIAPRSGARPADGILIQMLIVSASNENRIFPKAVRMAGEIGESAALRLEGTITKYVWRADAGARWTDFEKGEGGVRLDVRLVDQRTGRIVDQLWVQGQAADRKRDADPAFADAAKKIARHLYWNKSNKPADLD